MSDLLPCPFCGTSAQMSENYSPPFVFCPDCGTRKTGLTESIASANWNTRTQQGKAVGHIRGYQKDSTIANVYVDSCIDLPPVGTELFLHPPADNECRTAIDNACIVGPQTTIDSYASPKEALDAVIDWNVDVALDPRVSQRATELADSSTVRVPVELPSKVEALCPAVENDDELPPIKYALRCGRLINEVRTMLKTAQERG